MKNKGAIILSILYIFGLFYLLLPASPLPALPDSFKSDEPGDTGQIPEVVAAYYTNTSRQDVIDFYRANFDNSSLLNIPLITYKLNHPPEYAREIIIDTIHSSFFEELVHPLRESLFINGYDIEVRDKKTNVVKQLYIMRGGKKYVRKITLYYTSSNRFARVLIFSLVILAIYAVIHISKSILRRRWRAR